MDISYYQVRDRVCTKPITGQYLKNLFWFSAIRGDMIENALLSGAKIAVFDRYLLSSVVYANAVGAVDIAFWLGNVETSAVSPRPVVNFVFTVHVGSGNGGCFETEGVQRSVKKLFLCSDEHVDWPVVFIEKGDMMAQEEQIKKWLMNVEL